MKAEEGDNATHEYTQATVIGEAENFDDAVRQAYQKLRDRGLTPPFRIVETLAKGGNPFSGYSVVMRKDS